jgi:hypothetical protein
MTNPSTTKQVTKGEKADTTKEVVDNTVAEVALAKPTDMPPRLLAGVPRGSVKDPLAIEECTNDPLDTQDARQFPQ